MTSEPMASNVEYRLALRIWHPVFPPERISNELGFPIGGGWAVGSTRKSVTGDILSPQTMTYWTSPFEPENPDGLSGIILALCRRLDPQVAFLREIRATGGRIEFFVGWFSGTHSGETLEFSLLQMVGRLEADLALDVYAEPQAVAQHAQQTRPSGR